MPPNSSTQFTGSYDGGGYTIENLTIDGTTYQGLFGYVGTGATVKNAALVDCVITSSGSVGGVVGQNYGTVENCYVSGSVSGGSFAGGVVGYNYGTVENCYTSGSVSGTSYVGGVVGSNREGGTVENCYATGSVSGTSYVGGVVGWNYGAVENCYASGSVSGSVRDVGGVVGYNPSGTVSNCYASGNVSGASNVGGVVGYNVSGGTIENCVALNGTITRSSDTLSSFGHVVGNNYNATSTNSYARYGMRFIDQNGNSSTTFPTYSSSDNGTAIRSTQWGSSSWWMGTALWSSAIWDFSGIGATNLPTLKNVGGTQNPEVQP